MARVPPPEFDPAKVVVLPHAVERAGLRGLVDEADFARAHEEVRAMVIAGVERGEVHDSLPKTFVGTYEKAPRRQLPPWQRVVVYDQRVSEGEHFKAAFIVDVAEAPRLTVITSFRRLR